eukprot:TRINITY_DN49145_c0_g1_i1.p1 TRINITY_DN49145_c0_g1~~TRINITY_DN49145_c0_g1_i1.p1  ORF type:complete len:408 (+),score=43.24 TRINITY_DN49145_c0_g1_i1:192-1415(+)
MFLLDTAKDRKVFPALSFVIGNAFGMVSRGRKPHPRHAPVASFTLYVLTPFRLVRSSECWDQGFDTGYLPIVCCHPKLGPAGLGECWDAVWTARHCCNESTWDTKEKVDFHGWLMKDWLQKCKGQPGIALSDQPSEWKKNLFPEVHYWFTYVRDIMATVHQAQEKELPAFVEALNPDLALDDRLQQLLMLASDGDISTYARREAYPTARSPRIRVLDIGSGPVSTLGYSWLGVADIDLVPTDPLSCVYEKVLEDLRVHPPTSGIPRPIEAERLQEAFGEGAFDAVHCSNAMDHSYDPMRGLMEALRVLRSRGPFLLRHWRNSGHQENYTGLHKWNFDVRGRRLVLWRSTFEPIDVEEQLVADKLIAPGSIEARIVGPTEGSRYAAEMARAGILGAQDEWVEAVLWRL